MQLSIYTASAGSGKTHTLTREYLRLALSTPNPHYFSTIQAVTFTKKATLEMKERIVQELYRLANKPDQSPFAEELAESLKLTPSKLQERAVRALRALLLDYSSFRVRTIDSFFQEVVRSFAHELGHSGALRVQIDSKPLLQDAVLGVLAAQEEGEPNKELNAWLSELTQEQIEKGKQFDIKKILGDFASQLETEAVKLLRANHKFPTREAVGKLRSEAAKIIKSIEAAALDLCEKALDLLKQANVEITELSYKTGGVFSAILACQRLKGNLFDKNELLASKARLVNFIEASEDEPFLGLVSKGTNAEGREKARALESRLSPIVEELRTTLSDFRAYSIDKAPLYMTARQILRYSGLYGVLIDIDDALQRLKLEGGLMLLSDAPSLISSLLKDTESDVPFLYEKIGARVDHHMIDEFQDTSRMQYSNFLPLLKNSLASGKDCLIVGDAKQSIYRFRNSDSSLLTTSLPRDFGEQAYPHQLKHNWRSTPEIIKFNNELYQRLPKLLRSLFEAQWAEATKSGVDLASVKAHLDAYLEQLIQAYADVEQEVPEKGKKQTGQVVLHHYQKPAKKKGSSEESESEEGEDDDDTTDLKDAIAQLPKVIIDLQERGYKPSDIAILVRAKKTATAVAEALMQFPEEEKKGYSLNFVSEEALLVSNAYSVRFLIAALGYIGENGTPLHQAILQEAYHQLFEISGKEPKELSEEELQGLRDIGRRGLYEVAEILIHQFGQLFHESEGAYLVKLLDMLYLWEQEQSADISSFLQEWEERGSEQKIVSVASDDALSLMTIHKSKGLGFPVVLLPDLGWKLDAEGNSSNILWCPILGEEGLEAFASCGVDSVPITYGSALQQSYFAKTYFEEKLRYQFDALNLLYVATTRPKQELHIWLGEEVEASDKKDEKGKKDKKPRQPKTIEALFFEKGGEDHPLWEGLSALSSPQDDPTKTDREAPLINHQRKEQEEVNTLQVTTLSSYPIASRLAILREGLEYFTEEKQRQYGRTMHLVLSEIKQSTEIDAAIGEAVYRGYIKEDETDELSSMLRGFMEHPDTARWFDGSGIVYNERAIIGGGLETSRRPDRVVRYPDGHIEVIDYKFGAERKQHLTQVKGYMKLLRQMGFDEVSGYLCYLQGEAPKVVPVPLD
ncbi:UvrD-helicase domain-containing protein [uncultured Porphyromonas sp.]|uniref:UvrD-helicase domain-containing protein n=1 Tax=uncultured Porphyromonas sp. TaxID=159274 RepID=UPI002612455F|nr:UvrD-helicase domain-containing protein [uncultured Porphyromonas sp.]